MATRNSIKDYIFYKIFCVDKSVELSYIGSTADWKQRNRSHKSNCNNQNSRAYNTKVYTSIRENGGWNNFKMIEIGKQEQLTLRQAEQIEEQYRKELNADMNGRSCFLTEEEKQDYWKKWRENNKEQRKEWCKKWYENNKEYNKEWRENNKEHIKEYRQNETVKANKAIANKTRYHTDVQKTKRETPEYKAKQALYQKKHRDKIKLQKEQLKNNKE